jgi:hypothetical protein
VVPKACYENHQIKNQGVKQLFSYQKKYILVQFDDASDNSGKYPSATTSRGITRIGQLEEKYSPDCLDNPEKKNCDYFIFKIVDYICVGCGLPRSGARRRALAQTIGNARGLDINSLLSAEAHKQDLRFRRHQQHDDPNSAQGLDNNFASNHDSTRTSQLHHRRLRHADHAAPDKS